MTVLANIWWVILPRFFRRLGTTPATIFSDGLYITSLPLAAFLLPIAAGLIGLSLGWIHHIRIGKLDIGFQVVFSESLIILLIATVIGVLSAHLGAWFVGGFAIGDFFLFEPAWMFEGSVAFNFFSRLSHIIEYALLAILLTQIPILTKTLLGQFYAVAMLGRTASFIITCFGHVVLTILLVYLWAQAVPVLIRPVYTWGDIRLSSDGMVILQESVWILLVAAALASMLRMALQGAVAFIPSLNERITATGEAIADDDVTPLTERVPRVVRAFCSAVWGAFLLSGLYWPWFGLPKTEWIDGVWVGFVIFVLQLFRLGVIRLPIGGWARLVAKVPILIRFAIGLLIMLGIGALILRFAWSTSFRPMLFSVTLGLILFYILNPGLPANIVEKGEEQPA